LQQTVASFGVAQRMVRTAFPSLLEELQKVAHGTDPELDLDKKLGCCATRDLLQPRLVHDQANLLVGRPEQADAFSVFADNAVDIGDRRAPSSEPSSGPPKACVDSWGSRDRASIVPRECRRTVTVVCRSGNGLATDCCKRIRARALLAALRRSPYVLPRTSDSRRRVDQP
jgi:hypothetical protein